MDFHRRRRHCPVPEQLETRCLLAGDIALVRSFDTWNGGVIPSTDPADLTYHAPSGRLLIADSEINELPQVFEGNNVFEVSLDGGTLVRSIPTGNSEPTGIIYSPFDDFFYVTNDDKYTITRYDETFASPLAVASTVAIDSTGHDPEGITVDPATGELYVAQGVTGGKQVHVYDANLQLLRRFWVGNHIYDPEGIAFNPLNGHLYLVSTPDMAIFEYTTAGEYVQQFDIGGFEPTPVAPQGLAFAPTSDPTDDPNALAVYIADGMIDNFEDGRIYEAVLVNQPPNVDAGTDQIAVLNDIVTLQGFAMDDGLSIPAVPTTVHWSVISGPGSVVFSDPFSLTPTVEFSDSGSYVLGLSASDGTLSATDTMKVSVIDPVSTQNVMFFATTASVLLPNGIQADNEDIVRFDGAEFSIWFDGSDVGLASRVLGSFAIISDTEFIFSLTSGITLPGISNPVTNADVIHFEATQMGTVTSGTFSLYLDGSDVDLVDSSEAIDGLDLAEDGSLILSTSGNATVGAITVRDEDVLRFSPTSLGDTSSGSWSWYLDSSDIGLSVEDVKAISVGGAGEIYISLETDFTVDALVGNGQDILVFWPTTLGEETSGVYLPHLYFDGSTAGLGSVGIGALDFVKTDPNLRPVAVDDNIVTAEDMSVSFNVLAANGGAADSDADGSLAASTVSLVSMPANGTVTNLGDGAFIYIPATNFAGSDSFTYTVRDDDGAVSNLATVLLTVTPSNDPPQFSNLPDIVLLEGGVYSGIDLDDYFLDVETSDADASFEVVATFSGVSATIDAVTHQLIVTGEPGFVGQGDIAIRAYDSGQGPTAPLAATDQLHITVNPLPNIQRYFAVNSTTTIDGIVVANEDIIRYDGTAFSLFFDGSDVGLGPATVDAFAVLNSNEILLSFTRSINLPGISSQVENSDIVRFVADSWGDTTTGTFSLFLDGSDVGLSGKSADIDAADLLEDGRLIVSLAGTMTVNGISVRDEDLLVFSPTSLGETTSGTWDVYFDGSDVGASANDVNAVTVTPTGSLEISFHESFSLPGVAGENEDVVTFYPSQLGSDTIGSWGAIQFDGSAFGLDAIDLMAWDVVYTNVSSTVFARAIRLTDAVAANWEPVGLTVSSVDDNSVALSKNTDKVDGIPRAMVRLELPPSRAWLEDVAVARLTGELPNENASAVVDIDAAFAELDVANLVISAHLRNKPRAVAL